MSLCLNNQNEKKSTEQYIESNTNSIFRLFWDATYDASFYDTVGIP